MQILKHYELTMNDPSDELFCHLLTCEHCDWKYNDMALCADDTCISGYLLYSLRIWIEPALPLHIEPALPLHIQNLLPRFAIYACHYCQSARHV